LAKKATKKGTARRKTATKKTRKASRKSAPSARRRRPAAARKAAGRPATRKTAAKTAAKKTAPRTAARSAAKKTARRKTATRAAATRASRQQRTPKQPSRVTVAATAVRGSVAKAVAAVTGALPWSGSEPDAIEMLERDHRRFEELLRKGEDTTEQARATRLELLETLTRELNAHELMEEKVLYPALQAHPQARDIVLEGFQEHHVADVIVNELHQVATNDEQWGAKFKVLKENLEHHIQEEESEMFRAARGIFSKAELKEMAQRMLEVRSR
jgi:hypothetical protein